MKQRVFSLVAALVGIVFALGLVEVTAVAWLMLEEGRYIPAAQLFERTQNTYVRDLTKGTSCRYVDTLFPHPYVGFVYHGDPPCGLPNANNVGLPGDDFPVVRSPEHYTILLTGGSVASQLAQILPRPAPRYLEEELNRNYLSPNGKPFVVLNGGAGAWKEPQAFILFALYASSVDAVITLSGFNEYYMFRDFVRERLERPLGNFIDVNPLVAERNFGDAAIGWVMGRIAGRLSINPVLGQSHAAYMIVRGIEAVAKSKGGGPALSPLDRLFALPPEVLGDSERIFALQLSLFQKYWRATDAMARDNDAKAAFFFHPVPAYGKTLTAEEKAVASDPSYIGLYRRIVEAMVTQRSRSMAVFDLGDLFAEVKETVYADDAHLYRAPDGESLGYRLMAKRMAADVAEAWGLKRRQ